MKLSLKRFLMPALGALIFALALVMLHTALRHYRYHDVLRALHALPSSRLGAAILLTVANYLVLTGYDTLGLHYIRNKTLPYPRIAFASFIGYAVSQNLGFPLLTGAPVRFRLYSAWGLSAIEITNLVLFNSVTFFLGLFAVGGVVFLIAPLEIPAVLHLPVRDARPIGIVFLLLVACYLVWSAMKKKPLRIGAWEFTLPDVRLAVMQISLASIDWALAGSVFYMVVHPPGTSYAALLPVFLLAQGAGLISHIPAGLGVFEVIVLFFLSDAIPTSELLGALVAYRGIYYLLPLLLASVMFALHEVLRRAEHVRALARSVGRLGPALAPHAFAFSVFVSGAVLLVSAATPTTHQRLTWLNDFVPLPIIEASHFLASLAGAGLLLLGRGIQRRVDGAYRLSVGLLACGIVLSLSKGVDLEEAAILGVMLAALVPSRAYFYRRTPLVHERFTPGWVAAVIFVLVGAAWIGLFSYKHMHYSTELWWEFALRADAPRALRALVGIVVVLLFVATRHLLQPARAEPALPSSHDIETAEAIVRSTESTTAWLALVGDKPLLFNENRDAFIMYGVEGRSWVAMGDPVGGTTSEKAELIWEFRELVDAHSGWTVFYQVQVDNLPLYLDVGLTLLKIGEDARVHLPDFSIESPARARMRDVLERFDRDRCTFEIIPAASVAAELPALHSVSEDWLRRKRTQEKAFSLGRFAKDYLQRTDMAVVRCNSEVVAFANLWLAGNREEISVDLMRYSEHAPDDAMEFLFLELMLWGRERGYEWFNLGMAPLVGPDNAPLAPLWNRLGALVFRYGENFYSFQALRQYKQHFDPVWMPRYLALPGGLPLPPVLGNVAALIGGSPTYTPKSGLHR